MKNKKWNDSIYKATHMQENKNPIYDETVQTRIIWIDPDDTEMEKGIQRGYREKFSTLTQMKGNFEIMEQITKTGNQKLSHLKFFRIIQSTNEQTLWDNLQRVKGATSGNENISMHDVKGMDTNMLRKMAEYIFGREERQIIINTHRKRKTRDTERKTYALVVETAGDYKGTLKTVKETIKEKDVGKGIIGLRSSKDGRNLVISTEKDTQTANQIEGALGNLKVTKKTEKKEKLTVIHIRGLDAITTIEEVIEGIREEIGPVKKEDIKTSGLRPNINNTQAITVSLPSTLAEKLSKQGNLKIGLVKCRVEKRIEMRRCDKCWSYDHRTKDCSSPKNLEGACYKCGDKMHKAKECQKEEYCPVCDKTGHKAGIGKCKAFKQSLTNMRKAERKTADQTRTQNKPRTTPQQRKDSNTPGPAEDCVLDLLLY